MKQRDPIIFVEEIAEQLRLTERTVRDMFRAGDLPGVKIGRRWSMLESELDAWYAAQPKSMKREVNAK